MSFLKRVNIDAVKFLNSLQSLGGGNHYIELSINELDEYLISVHSGSRNLGQKVCNYHVNQSKFQTNISEVLYSKKLDNIKLNYDKKLIPEEIKKLKEEMKIGVDREYLQDEYLFNYLIDMIFTQHYASINRRLMMDKIKDILGIDKFDTYIETVHNYIDFSTDDFMIRKGAISAKKDEICLVPISQKFGTFLVKAKGNKDWNESLCHGAGRTMSRSQAKDKITVDQVEKSMKGIVCRINKNVVDESEFCYKKPNIIRNAISDNAEILSVYTPILNIKDVGETISWKERKEKAKAEKSRDLNIREMRKMKGK
jgi:RNA-splicing ligase RtcB